MRIWIKKASRCGRQHQDGVRTEYFAVKWLEGRYEASPVFSFYALAALSEEKITIRGGKVLYGELIRRLEDADEFI